MWSQPQVELAHGTGIKILKHQWTSALQAQTATSMVRVLLMAAFPLEVLIHSNLKGKQFQGQVKFLDINLSSLKKG